MNEENTRMTDDGTRFARKGYKSRTGLGTDGNDKSEREEYYYSHVCIEMCEELSRSVIYLYVHYNYKQLKRFTNVIDDEKSMTHDYA